MKVPGALLVAAIVFGICFLFDKGFTRIFRNKKQHKSGKSVRLNKRFATIGLLITVLSIAAIVMAVGQNWLLFAGGCVLLVVGIFLIVYYMSFGVFYDDEGFVLTTFGKKSTCYRYNQIAYQQLFNSYQNLVMELVMDDGRSVQLMAGMEGVYPFLDKASSVWMRQKGLTPDVCDFYNPDNSCWFPPMED